MHFSQPLHSSLLYCKLLLLKENFEDHVSYFNSLLDVWLLVVIVMEAAAVDPYTTNPGPIDGSVLYDQDKHVSAAVWDGQVLFSS